ncbi:hypothetical protein RN001_013217 [Aquatica leii]|uniref:O-acyltransferase WSD1 C-terminal domain-containing protein n=1 Tax=Aquatica leii TaxID=1421715 RepID=A0AAN7SCA7_9COLE|nr:hypothetical protein RN001_013217 [Aquatica leii]
MENSINAYGYLFVFSVVIFFSPLLILSYLSVFIINKIWISCISVLNPHLDFLKSTTIRSLVDTHRNQGIFTLLLNVKGPANSDAVRRHLQEVLDRKDKRGSLTFPRLKQHLIKRCGKYAWRKENFNLDLHFITAPSNYRGRSVSDINIQDYITDIVSKYLPNGVSPWQMIIIPSSDIQHYILLRLHHALVNEGLNIADLLPIIQPNVHKIQKDEAYTPLVQVFKNPKYIPLLKERFQEDFTNLWNEFVSIYDPLEQSKLMKMNVGLFQYFAMMLITTVAICKEFRKGYGVVKNNVFSKMKYFHATFVRETNRRQMTFSNFLNALFETIHPINTIKEILNWWYWTVLLMFKIPYFMFQEIMTLYSWYKTDYCGYSNTIVGFLYGYIPLFYNASKEIYYYLKLLIQAPTTVLEQILFEPESIQTIPPCGRKVVSWSDSVDINYIRKIAKSTGASETDILLATVSSTISRYCAQAGIITPLEIPVTIRNVNSNYIFLSGSDVKPQDSVSGLIGLRLPVLTSEKDETFLENLSTVKSNFNSAMESQPISYLLTTLQTKYGILTNIFPPTLIEILLKYLSRKYTISITEITNNYNCALRTTWGQEISNAIYWRPPQANMSISLCFNQYGDRITLGVMCDAQLLPHHSILTREFSDHIEDLAIAAHIN